VKQVKDISYLNLMVDVSNVIAKKPTCFIGTNFGGVILVKLYDEGNVRYRLYPVHKFRLNNFFPIASLLELAQFFEQLKWKATGVR
jgi:hypothetical protein